MDYLTIFLIVSFLLTFFYYFTISNRRNSRFPPGPYPFPVIGNLLELGDKPHYSLAKLSKRYGPLMSLNLGSITTVVITSPHIAKEVFQTHDQSFSSRVVPDAARMIDHHRYSMVWLPAGDQWRRLRRITREYMFSMQRLDASGLARRDKVQELLEHVNHYCSDKKAVNIGAAAFTTTVNILSNAMFSRDLSQYDSAYSEGFKDAVWSLMELLGKPNLSDYFPILKPFDPQGFLRRSSSYAKKLLSIFDMIIDQRFQERSSSSYAGSFKNNDLLDLLLDLNLQDESEITRDDMRHLFLDFFVGGTDTTSTTLEWAMSELIRNPNKMEKARSELAKFMENNNKVIGEDDISKLPYLQAIIKETFRLHPPGPLLVPHCAMLDLQVQGFIVPKDAQILCNVWAMGRDPSIWSDPEMFMPERFLDIKIDYKGHDFMLIPFGAGRRICPGLNFSHRMLHVLLGSLIHNFQWKLEGDMRAQDMDMGEKFGLSLSKNVPLMAIPIKI